MVRLSEVSSEKSCLSKKKSCCDWSGRLCWVCGCDWLDSASSSSVDNKIADPTFGSLV